MSVQLFIFPFLENIPPIKFFQQSVPIFSPAVDQLIHVSNFTSCITSSFQPLMQRFQKALFNHLEKQNEKVTLALKELVSIKLHSSWHFVKYTQDINEKVSIVQRGDVRITAIYM